MLLRLQLMEKVSKYLSAALLWGLPTYLSGLRIQHWGETVTRTTSPGVLRQLVITECPTPHSTVPFLTEKVSKA